MLYHVLTLVNKDNGDILFSVSNVYNQQADHKGLKIKEQFVANNDTGCWMQFSTSDLSVASK